MFVIEAAPNYGAVPAFGPFPNVAAAEAYLVKEMRALVEASPESAAMDPHRIAGPSHIAKVLRTVQAVPKLAVSAHLEDVEKPEGSR